MALVDVCLCTHQPRRDVLATALGALARQTFDRDAFRVLVIDNASAPALDGRDLAPLAGITHELVREDRLGAAYARARAIREASAPILVFVDDDNELAPDYLERSVAILEADPTLGCIGGKLLLARDVVLPTWFEPWRDYVGIRDDLGEAPLRADAAAWSRVMPPTAGMAVRRPVTELYLELEHRLAGIGRRGTRWPGSCEDILLARQAHRLGLACGYFPELVLVHHVDHARLRFDYLLRFFFAVGFGEARVDAILGGSGRPPTSLRERWREARIPRDPRAIACLSARQAGRLAGRAPG